MAGKSRERGQIVKKGPQKYLIRDGAATLDGRFDIAGLAKAFREYEGAKIMIVDDPHSSPPLDPKALREWYEKVVKILRRKK